ncbi:YqaE/Pmp3 family membrane protein [Aureivirga sp. CE67]|uniref:YqaE/Pmp3 family membrane protein n=1 Tax=Aureivirga sp. CE67 TaxID=1788983 RepID=UPI0018CB09C8|nr:YqaE/Pmp3 family membrane protein [Aureivirga sp. CE67]
MLLIAILLPWLSFFLRGKILTGILCLILQLTLIGWLPAALWAVFSYNNAKNEKAMRKLEKKLKANRN